MSAKTLKISGWVLSAIISLLFLMSAYIKISLGETGLSQASGLGIAPGVLQIIGLIELAAVLLFLIPRTGVVGSLLLIAYMGGAIAIHVTTNQSLGLVVILESLIWIAAALRYPELVKRLFPALAGKVRAV